MYTTLFASLMSYNMVSAVSQTVQHSFSPYNEMQMVH